MTNECPSCGRMYPSYAQACKCGHDFSSGTGGRMDKISKQFTINGTELKCPHCAGHSFSRRSSQLNTAGMTFFDLDWMNKSAEVFVCDNCGRLEWFLEPSVVIQNDGSRST